jgi:hypothetical protein
VFVAFTGVAMFEYKFWDDARGLKGSLKDNCRELGVDAELDIENRTGFGIGESGDRAVGDDSDN